MAQSSEDGIDRESHDYLTGYKEALDSIIQRLNTMMVGSTFRHPLTAGGIEKARNSVMELAKAHNLKIAAKQQAQSEPTPTLDPNQPKATTPTI